MSLVTRQQCFRLVLLLLNVSTEQVFLDWFDWDFSLAVKMASCSQVSYNWTGIVMSFLRDYIRIQVPAGFERGTPQFIYPDVSIKTPFRHVCLLNEYKSCTFFIFKSLSKNLGYSCRLESQVLNLWIPGSSDIFWGLIKQCRIAGHCMHAPVSML